MNIVTLLHIIISYYALYYYLLHKLQDFLHRNRIPPLFLQLDGVAYFPHCGNVSEQISKIKNPYERIIAKILFI